MAEKRKIKNVEHYVYEDIDEFRETYPNTIVHPDWRKAEEGDWVIITRYAGSRVKIDGGELRIINEDEILAVVDDPRDIFPANIM